MMPYPCLVFTSTSRQAHSPIAPKQKCISLSLGPKPPDTLLLEPALVLQVSGCDRFIVVYIRLLGRAEQRPTFWCGVTQWSIAVTPVTASNKDATPIDCWISQVTRDEAWKNVYIVYESYC
jgi:hypothetical protein